MPAIDPAGSQSYWFQGMPFQGINRSISEGGTQTYWFQGLPYQFLYPAGGASAVPVIVGGGFGGEIDTMTGGLSQ